MQISNEGLTRMTLGQLLELGLHSEWLNNLQRILFGKHDNNILFGYLIVRDLIPRKWRRTISLELGFCDWNKILKGDIFCEIFQQLICIKERVHVVSELAL